VFSDALFDRVEKLKLADLADDDAEVLDFAVSMLTSACGTPGSRQEVP